MPRELSPAEERAFARYEALGTPDELQKQQGEIEKLKGENADRRQKVKDLEAELVAAKAAVPEGATVLTGDDAKALEELKAKGVKLAEVPGVITERDTLKQKDAQRTREDAFRDAVDKAGWPKETVATLLDMRSLDGSVIEVKKEKVPDGKGGEKEVEVPYVTLAGDGQKPQKLTEFAANAPQLKGLRTEATGGGGGQGTGGAGTSWARQSSGGESRQAPSEDQIRDSVQKTTNYTL